MTDDERMRLTSRLKTALWFVAVFVLIRVAELNTDGLLEKSGLDRIVADAFPDQAGVPVMSLWTDYVTPSLAFLIGPFGLGFVIAAVLFSLPDVPMVRKRLNMSRNAITTDQKWRPEGLHVSGMTVNAKRLYTDHYIEIAVHGFNATGGPISIGDASGNVMFREDVNSAPELSKSLPSPRVQYDRYPSKDIPNLTRIDVLIEQRVPNDITEIIRSRLEAQKSARLDFSSLTIMVTSDAEGSGAIRLPIWTSASLYQNADQINVTPVFEVQSAVIVGVRAR